MKRATRNLIAVAVCAVVLGGAAAALSIFGGTENGASSSPSSTDASLKLVSKKSEDVVSMKVTNSSGSYTLVPAPSTSSSAASSSPYSETDYSVEELAGCPVDMEEIRSVVENGFSLVATKNLGTVSSLSDYGLDDPQAEVSVKFKDGTAFNYKIGKATATDSSAYYVCGQNSKKVYVASIDAGLLKDKTYFVDKEMLNIQNTSSSSSSQSSSDFTKIVLSGSVYPKGVTIEKTSSDMDITSPGHYGTDSNKISSLEQALSSLTADSVEAVNPNADALKKYGFDSPTAAVEFTANKKNYKLTIGKQTGSSYYAMLGGVNVVYKVTADSVSAIIKESLFSLRSKLIFLPYIETVKSVQLTSGNVTSEINVTRKENTASSTEGKKSYTYQVTGNNGKSLDYEKNYKHFYQTMIGIELLADSDQVPSGSPSYTIQYRYFDKSGTDTLAFYPADSRRMLAVLNGNVYGTVVSDDVEKVFSVLNQFESGKTIADPNS